MGRAVEAQEESDSSFAVRRVVSLATGGLFIPHPYRTALALGGWAATHRSYVNGRLVLAGFDPDEVLFRHVLDLTWALVLEIYREYGMKFQEATEELHKRLSDPLSPQDVRAPDNESSLAMLQAMMGGSDFEGPRG